MFDRDIAILGGCGHVGLPLGIAFADQGQSVVLQDTNGSAVETVNSGRMPFREEGASELLPKVLASGKLIATTDGGALSTAETVVVVIGTPVDRFLNPDIGAVLRAVDEVARHLVDGQLLVLRSTVYPGVTAMVEKRMAEKGMDVDVVFCPERIAEGHALEELSSLPQIVSGRQARADRAGGETLPDPHSGDRRAHPRGGGAGQALHQHLAVHQVCDRQSALHDRQ